MLCFDFWTLFEKLKWRFGFY